MIRNPSSSDVIAQQMVQDATCEGKNEPREQEYFFQAADSTGNGNDTDKIPHSGEPEEATRTISPKISGIASNKKLKRSATTIPTSKESVTARPTSVEDKLIAVPNSQNGENVPQHGESPPPPIIEVKKPPTPVAAWDNISQIIVNKPSDPQKSACNDKKEVESPAVGDTKAVNPSLKSKHSTCLKENKSLKSSIPRFTKTKPKLMNLTADKNEKKVTGSPTNLPKTCSPSRQLQIMQQNQHRKTTSPSRSRASTLSSRNLSPSSGRFPSRSKTPSSSVTPTYCSNKDKQAELHNMLEEMCSTLDQIKDEVDKEEVEIQGQSNLSELEKEEGSHLKVNYIMPAKDGAGETYLRSVKNLDGEAINLKGNSDCDPLSKKTDFLHCLSELSGQNQLSLKELRNIIKEIIKSNDGAHTKQLELQFYHVEQSQTDLVQKLVRTITKFYDEKENLMTENKKYHERQEKLIPEIEDKVAMLESENQSLLDKLKLTTHNLEEERIMSQKRKITGQNLAQTKSKVQRAEGKLQQIESKVNELSNLIKKLEALVKQKESLMEQHMKKIKLVETTVNELELENKTLRDQIENIKSNEEERLTNLIHDSQELKDAKGQLVTLNEQLDEEVDRREKTSAKLLETTTRLKSMEEKCKTLTSLVESAKNEVKLKQVECADKESKYKEEIDQLRTELQARKVMLKVAEDEVLMTKVKLDKAELHYRQEQKKEREISSVEEQLRLDLTLRDEQITQLQEQIKSLIEKKFNNREPSKSSKNRINKLSEKQSASSFNERVALTAQVVDLERTIDTLAKDNLQLNQLLNQKNLELDQRDRIVKMQTEVLKIRDELIYLMKSKEAKHEEDIKRLNNIIQEREHAIAKEWNRAIEENWQSNEIKSWQNSESSIIQETGLNPTEESMYLSGTMYELYSTLEKKQMELELMQQRVQQLEGMQEAYNQQRTRQEVGPHLGSVTPAGDQYYN